MTYATADHVMDFDIWRDTIDADIAGTWWNYAEAQLEPYDFRTMFHITTDEQAFKILGEFVVMRPSDYTHVFYSDGVNGYLFSELNGDRYLESGLELKGVTSVDQFDYWDIV